MERARRRMMAEVPSATVVITNPTHIAVALRYEPPAMAAPKLVAKGVGPLAGRIRELARAHRVPLIPAARPRLACRGRARCRGAAGALPRGRRGDRLRAAAARQPLTY